ncbi:protein of unknown function [Candidatus Hydrogenisulfobacillus filiaventi]|uniref:RHS repeat-associated core domain-containing protein n=1 Tax=Candidatus Hydrogenisulfobacillus filiaventi TaxID=2707344 RepID=A0A6F8ZKC0_9FIRM|nr:protein of unknown function [Candidatus Hydrogenisulfobacillus filiaventi]
MDGRGDVVLTEDGSGTRQSTYSYDAFGNLLGSSGSGGERQFGGRGVETDGASGLDLMGARWYDPATGRFLSPDPLPAEADAPQSLNAYAYAWDNPLRYTDPSGESPWALAMGRAFEAYVKMRFGLGPGVRIATETGYRVIDALTETALHEIKWSLSPAGIRMTPQIEDFLEYAEKNRKAFVLYRNRGARLSRALEAALDAARADDIEVLEREVDWVPDVDPLGWLLVPREDFRLPAWCTPSPVG